MIKDKDGFDSKKRMGNSAQRGVGVNSPAMMEARKGFSKSRQSTSDGYMTRQKEFNRKSYVTKMDSGGYEGNIKKAYKEFDKAKIKSR